MCERPVRFPQFAVELQCLSRSHLGHVEGLLSWRHSSTCQHHVGIGDSYVCHRIIGMVDECLLEESNALAHALFRALIPEVAAFQINLVCGGRDFGRVRQAPLFP